MTKPEFPAFEMPNQVRDMAEQSVDNAQTMFNDYMSKAKDALADRTKVDLPVLTIAMDLGYNSLATFNRAFRANTGMAPTEFRKQAIAQS